MAPILLPEGNSSSTRLRHDITGQILGRLVGDVIILVACKLAVDGSKRNTVRLSRLVTCVNLVFNVVRYATPANWQLYVAIQSRLYLRPV